MTTENIIRMIGLITVLLLCACSNPYDDSKTERKDTAKESDCKVEQINTSKENTAKKSDCKAEWINRPEENQDTIVIGVAWANDKDEEGNYKEASFVKGAKLATIEINDDGRVLGRTLELIINEKEVEWNSEKKRTLRQKQDITVEVARSFAANPRVVAVTGHRSSSQAVPASIVYKYHGIVFLAPTSTNLNLTDHQFKYVFRMTPNNDEIAKQLANYCLQKGYQKIVVLHGKSSYGEQLADAFVSSFVKKDNTEKEPQTKIVLRRSFFSTKKDFSDLMVELKQAKNNGGFDAIFIATGAGMAAKIYQESRDMKFYVPFIGAEGLDNKKFWDVVKKWEHSEKIPKIWDVVKKWEHSEKIPKKSVVPTVFDTTEDISKTFIGHFRDEYKVEPDRYAALGYDSIKLLIHAIKKANSTRPFKIAETLRYMPPCQAVTGQYWFRKDGDVRTRKFHFKLFRHGQFEYDSIDLDEQKKTVAECGNIDWDNDGIPNDIDACDNRKDNISEIEDKYVHQTGTLKGCLIDDDNDGVPNYRDKCQNKPLEISKGVYRRDNCPKNRPLETSKGVYQQGEQIGCQIGCPIDSDNDKVPDYHDKCPENKHFEIRIGVDELGCLIDTDKDEVDDYKDVCPRDTSEERSKGVYQQGDQIGCPIDTDKDGVPDYRDKSPKDQPEEIEKGINPQGYPIDTDKDKIPDYKDVCPRDTLEERSKGIYQQGVQIGCPIDTDKDRVPDYKDVCLKNSPEEISKGVFLQGTHLGCPIDSDQDGVPDYRDDCLNNSTIEIGKGVDSRGCPRDTDDDKVPDYKDVCFNNSPKEISKGVFQQGVHLGCPLDKDNDGVPDYRDSCPNNSRFEIRKGVDSRGCPRV
jgi:ABC-type branched-subunit amino acid transport system substrate-binding protein